MPEEEEEVAQPDETETAGKDLVYAARLGDVEQVKSLLADGVPVGFYVKPAGWTALKWAASEGFEDVLTLLLDHGAAEAEVEAAQLQAMAGVPSSGSPLHWASYKGHARLVWRLLLAKPKLSAKELDGEGQTPLHCAAAGGHLSVVETMLSQGVDVKLLNSYGNRPVDVTTNAKCRRLLTEAAVAAQEGRYFLCACSGEFCSEAKSVADVVIDRVSAPNSRPVRYSSECVAQIRQAEDSLSLAVKAADVPRLEEAIAAADKIGASLPLIVDATAALERLRAQIALNEASAALQGARPLQDRALLRPMHAPIAKCRETGVPAAVIAEAEQLCQTAESEAVLHEMMEACQPLKLADAEDAEEGGATEPPAADSELARKAEGVIGKLAAAIGVAQSADATPDTVELAELELAFLTGEHDLRKALLAPKEGVTEEGAPTFTQHDGTTVYSALEDLTFRDAFLDASLEKCMAAGTAAGVLTFATTFQKELKAALKTAQVEDEERRAREEAAAAKAAKKGKKKK